MEKILITGSGSGLGAELAYEYAKKNTYIILVGRNENKLKEVKENIIKNGGNADYIKCDISDINSVKNLSETIANKYGKIDYLINNAGVGYFAPFVKQDFDEMDKMININIKGTIIITKYLLPYIKHRIINIISTAGLKGKPNEAVYVASKFAIRGFTESLQKEYEKSDLKITSVYVGGMNTPFWENSTHISDKSKLRLPENVAKQIIEMDDGRLEIHIQ